MTTALAPIELPPIILEAGLAETIAERAKAVDKAEIDARYGLDLLGEAGLLEKGLPVNRGGGLLDMARIVREVSRLDLSVAFTLWAHRMTLEYLAVADTEYTNGLARQLAAGTRPGVTGMAGAFKEAAGAGEIDLTATPAEGGYLINGKLNWASNLYEDAVLVTAAKTAEGKRLLIALEAGATGLTLGSPFGLLGLNATASAWVSFEDVFIPAEQVLTEEFSEFIKTVRPTFITLQISECLGLAEAAIAAASKRLFGINEVFAEDVASEHRRILDLVERQEAIIRRVGDSAAAPVTPVELLELRLDSAQAAVAASALEIRVAGGAGYAKSSPASRRFREATFIPVQSPSESQLRWELARAREASGV